MPAIAEIITAIKKHDGIWSDRFHALDCVEGSYAELIEAIAKSEAAIAAAFAAEEERRERQRKYLEAKAAPLVVGDRVRHRWLGLGVITKPWGPGGWLVLFDNNREDARLAEYMDADCLEKLVEGDAGFVPPPQPALIEHKPLVPMSWVDAQPAAALAIATPEPSSETVKE
jgi:hypothetical protein